MCVCEKVPMRDGKCKSVSKEENDYELRFALKLDVKHGT